MEREIKMTVKLQFYLKCTRCGKVEKGTSDGDWMVYPDECSHCKVRLIPEIKLPEEKKDNSK